MNSNKRFSIRRFAVSTLIVIGLGLLPVFQTTLNATGVTEDRESILLQPIIDQADTGAVIHLESGRYAGPVNISKALTLIGDDSVTIHNEQEQSAISIQAEGVKLEGFTIEQHGRQPAAAVQITGSNNEISELMIRTKGAGLLVRDAATSVIRNNTIEWAGASTASSSQKGNGIDLYNSHNSRIEGNQIEGVLDSIYLENSRNVTVNDNRFMQTRYGIHCMYIDGSSVTNNTGEGNMTGAMIMGVKNTVVSGNTFRKQSSNVHSQGILLYDVHQSKIRSNTVEGNRVGMNIAESTDNKIYDNGLIRNFVGIQMVLSEGNQFTKNRFVSNVIDASTMDSKDNILKENYWDSFQGLDLNQDGISELSYAINPFYEQLISRNAAYQLFFQSPGMVFLSDLHSEGKSNWTTDESPQMSIVNEHNDVSETSGNFGTDARNVESRSSTVMIIGLLLLGLSASTMIYMGVWRK
ncbi:NosD domain-containing protein [Paenibacillus sp. RRE4]|uniref:right-handed parallel beta-helix repeat-containing protein n=1 Tax=Paenibacillus sp. RRE4 TaxID=2962587 RepID=UPI002882034E|nr:NosD domain-containing protein [Paenibacillus sp. RRE4]MDT0122797.1 NosD domain-containing protein [Paenibacillus sp. RRE4]